MKKILKNLAAAAMLGLVFCTGVTSHASNGNVVLVLDPGHDVHDAGARRTWNGVTYAEETITLKMAQYCKEELEKYSGIVVYMTRFSNNVDMDRYDRVKVAKDLGADALVSLHINSTGNQQDTVSGALAYVPISSNKADYAVEARALAADIVSNLSTVGMKNLGYLKGEGLGIIYYGRQWKIPTMIIEHGFVNNPSDCLKYYGSDAKIKAVLLQMQLRSHAITVSRKCVAGIRSEMNGFIWIRTAIRKPDGLPMQAKNIIWTKKGIKFPDL